MPYAEWNIEARRRSKRKHDRKRVDDPERQEQIKAAQRAWYQRNREQLLERQREWRERNSDKVAEQRARQRQRRHARSDATPTPTSV